MKKLYKNID